MSKIWLWLIGKKTYLVAATIALGTLVLLYLGQLTPSTALSVLLFAAAGLSATFRAALANHQAAELALLGELVATAKDAASRNLPAVTSDIEKVAVQGYTLATAVQADLNAGAKS